MLLIKYVSRVKLLSRRYGRKRGDNNYYIANLFVLRENKKTCCQPRMSGRRPEISSESRLFPADICKQGCPFNPWFNLSICCVCRKRWHLRGRNLARRTPWRRRVIWLTIARPLPPLCTRMPLTTSLSFVLSCDRNAVLNEIINYGLRIIQLFIKNNFTEMVFNFHNFFPFMDSYAIYFLKTIDFKNMKIHKDPLNQLRENGIWSVHQNS